jgi:hypothetical protein
VLIRIGLLEKIFHNPIPIISMSVIVEVYHVAEVKCPKGEKWIHANERLYTATLITAKAVIPAKAGIQTPSLRRQGTIILETWIPPYQVRGRLSQARNDKANKTYVVMYNYFVKGGTNESKKITVISGKHLFSPCVRIAIFYC